MLEKKDVNRHSDGIVPFLNVGVKKNNNEKST
jgi:hypothetical protein